MSMAEVTFFHLRDPDDEPPHLTYRARRDFDLDLYFSDPDFPSSDRSLRASRIVTVHEDESDDPDGDIFSQYQSTVHVIRNDAVSGEPVSASNRTDTSGLLNRRENQVNFVMDLFQQRKHVLSLDGPVVTASGFKDELAIVTHASDCLPSNEQMLEFRVLNITKGSEPLRGRLPLTPGSHLTWFGFSEEGQLSSYDSKGAMRVFTSQYGGSWLPLFSASKEKKSNENYWVVGLNASKLFCIVCKSPDLYPQVMPKPVLTPLNFSFPLASSDLGAEALENEFILNNTHLVQIQKQIEEVGAAGLDTTSLDDEAFNTEAAQDRCILKLIASCCNGDKLVRAIELVKLLSLEKSVRGAIKLVTVLKLPNLAERFNSILEERLLNESKRTAETTFPSSNCTASFITDDIAAGKKMISTEQSKLSGNGIPLSTPKLSAPLFTKKAKTQEPKVGTEKTDEKQTATADDDVGKVKTTEVSNNAGEMKKVGEVSEVSNDQEKVKKAEAPRRASNPFMKKLIK
ncbi:hypothetical protein C1H46_042303 [Malus baccata]|uniref:Uncharacterized protein n=1 Tax=Malus baccata TaxID=106549 RepID=A0A540KD58_MALBA|nr:hypothetical protein C1H46_042303 [Malus baccata]